uniref:Zgc:112185 n=1 Tax=Gadus morhua TaxID=8049 RepID=A0A8C4ZMQ5_GADMO
SGGSEPSPPGAQKPAPHTTLEACVPTESMAQSKPKKKKKSGKKKTTESSKLQETTSSLTAEQQLQRELDWVMEQLSRGLETQKVTPKQREDASRALKILRSGKAPLAKKRQVMRAMTGDYRRKMEEERQKQLKLIQSAMTSLQVRAVPDPKKSVFHRRAGNKPGVPGAGEQNARPALTSDPLLSGNETSHFVFTSSKEEFKFNFV